MSPTDGSSPSLNGLQAAILSAPESILDVGSRAGLMFSSGADLDTILLSLHPSSHSIQWHRSGPESCPRYRRRPWQTSSSSQGSPEYDGILCMIMEAANCLIEAAILLIKDQKSSRTRERDDYALSAANSALGNEGVDDAGVDDLFVVAVAALALVALLSSC